jgi:hypothetical protein
MRLGEFVTQELPVAANSPFKEGVDWIGPY